MVRIIEFICTCPAVCRLYLFPCRCYFLVATGGISIYHYFKARVGLPDPKGSLSLSILLVIMQFPIASGYFSVCQVPPEGGQPWRS